MRISDWSSDVCSSDLPLFRRSRRHRPQARRRSGPRDAKSCGCPRQRVPAGPAWLAGMPECGEADPEQADCRPCRVEGGRIAGEVRRRSAAGMGAGTAWAAIVRSEEHTSELQSLMRISYAVFCLKKKKYTTEYE